MSRREPTFIGQVQSVTGSTVGIQIRDDLSSSLLLINGISHRVGQIGAFLRIPLGYNQLYGVCTQVGAAAAPATANTEQDGSNRWISVVLFGEALGDDFQRGVSQYPTVGDEAHLVTERDLRVIYSYNRKNASVSLGKIAATSGIDAAVDLESLVSRHFCIVGSTGAGKSNLSAAFLRAVATTDYPSARILIIDPHGEYASAVKDQARVFMVRASEEAGADAHELFVPYWALPFDEFRRISFGELNTGNEAFIRDQVIARKIDASAHLPVRPPSSLITADSPIPFSANKFWFDLSNLEIQTYTNSQKTNPENPTTAGDAAALVANEYPAAAAGQAAPYAAKPRGLSKQLDLFKSRLTDSLYSFLYKPGDDLTPDLAGNATADVGALVHDWIGTEEPITILDVSSVPSDSVSTVVGTVLTLVYDTLLWATDTPISGKNQPLVVMVDEAHMIVPQGSETIAHRAVRRIAREGRKYGIGLGLITQRPTEIDQAALSQCGTMLALRLTNKADRGVISSALPDDLGNLAAMLPSLRTGEGIIVGEAMPIPSRVRFTLIEEKSEGNDPHVAAKWRLPYADHKDQYDIAVNRWRQQSQQIAGEGENE